MPYVVAGLVGVVVLWYLIAAAWASSVAKHQPELREHVVQQRFGWICPRCGRVEAPSCSRNRCGGPLVWAHRGTRIKCSRCHAYFIAHPMLFRQTPRSRRRRCRQCGWIGLVKDYKVD